MNLSAFYLDTWHNLSDVDRIKYCESLLKQLPTGWSFTGLETHQVGDQINSIACFMYQQAKFNLVPGNEKAVLGFDSASISMVAGVRKLYMQWHDAIAPFEDDTIDTEAEINEGIRSLKAKHSVPIHPFLCEVTATENNKCKPFEELLDPVTELGLQLATPDEWEYACAGGIRALFRWGNDAPGLHSPESVADYPIDESELDNHPNREKLLPLLEQFNGWDLHTKPNGFGLLMPHNPYHWELTSEKGIMRGGDGGGSICGGEGLFNVWMALATSYEDDWRTSYEKYGFVCGAYVRRILRLSEI